MRILILLSITLLLSCSKEFSSLDGWEVITISKSEQLKDIEKNDSSLVLINEDFLIERTEVTNKDYYAFIISLVDIYNTDSILTLIPNKYKRESNSSFDSILKVTIPQILSSNINEYEPIVGISYENAISYCKWKTIHEEFKLLIREGVFKTEYNINETSCFGGDPTTFKDYYMQNINRKSITNEKSEFRKVSIEDAVVSPTYTLPSKKEWFRALDGELDTSKFPVGKLKPTYFWQKIDSNKIICKSNIVRNVRSVKSPYENQLGVKGLIDNVSEFTIEKGIAIGGNFSKQINFNRYKLLYRYSQPQNNIGFRCVVKIKEIKSVQWRRSN